MEAISDRLFQFLGGTERDFLACCNVQRLACGGVAPGANLALANLKCAKAIYPNTISLLKMACDPLHHPGEQLLSLLLGTF
jgi:hypothetical protein